MLKDKITTATRGRPSVPEELLKEKIIQATVIVLLDQGYQAATIDNIAKQAGVAKKTIYRFVENREALIELVVLSWTDSFVPLFEQQATTADEFFDLLASNLDAIAQKVLSKEAIGLFQLLQTEFNQRDILLAKYQQSGIERCRHLLQNWLLKHQQKQVIAEHDFAIVSDFILSMAIAEPLRQMSLGLLNVNDLTSLKVRFAQVVRFCKPVLLSNNVLQSGS
ncbi:MULTISPECIES: TetR/AcrR family transcriptional regulator [Providencia]|uniref:TetR/AcrR family transcriptional regulator n=1 Tax=Providencia TaxID=586 RepID=UPI00083957D8|nr:MULTISPECIES: TetR/AcrR family transcriptional regulator [Providencia]MBP6122497.1 TetR/AcrR family transcriptional regulator [Providencia sp.]NIH23817.1 TetR/AcrR family transcriptional regulator [Providencia heimbachae]